MTRVLVCGGRDFLDVKLLDSVLDRLNLQYGFTLVIEGGARGADSLANTWAEERGITRQTFEADWDRHGRAAGPIRNARMLIQGKPDLVVAFPGGAGTRDMIKRAQQARVPVLVVSPSGDVQAADTPTPGATP